MAFYYLSRRVVWMLLRREAFIGRGCREFKRIQGEFIPFFIVSWRRFIVPPIRPRRS